MFHKSLSSPSLCSPQTFWAKIRCFDAFGFWPKLVWKWKQLALQDDDVDDVEDDDVNDFQITHGTKT